MGVESAALSHPYGSVSAAAGRVSSTPRAPENGDAQQRAEGEVVVAAFGREGRHGSCLLVYGDDAAQGAGLVNEETAA